MENIINGTVELPQDSEIVVNGTVELPLLSREGGNIDVIKVNGEELPIIHNAVDITVPTKTSDLENDADYVEESELSQVAFTGSYNDLTDTPSIPSVSVTQIQSTGTKIASIQVDNTTTDIYAPEGGSGVTEEYVKGFVGNRSATNTSATASQTDDTFLVSNVSSDLTLSITATSDTVLSDNYIEYTGSVTSTNGGTLTFAMPSGVTTTWMDGNSTNTFTMSAGKIYVYSILYCKTAAKAFASIHEVGAVAGGITMVTSASATPTVIKNTYASLTSTSISTITLEADSNSTTMQEWRGVFTTGPSQTSVTFAWSSGSKIINWSSSPSNLSSSTKYAFTVNGSGSFPYVGTIVPLLY